MTTLLQKLDEIHHLMEKQIVLQKKIFNLEEASSFLGISKSDLYKRTSTNCIPFFKPSGKLIYFQREDLEAWMLSNRQDAVSEISEKASNFQLGRGRRNSL